MRPWPDSNIAINKDQVWIEGAPFESNFYHSLSLMLPAYEKAMIKFCSQLKLPKDGDLRETVNRFVRQEDAHRRVHLQYNKALSAAGYSIRPLLGLADFNIKVIEALFPVPLKIGISAAGEHLTHLIAQYFMWHFDRYHISCDKQITELWHWHVIEEIEHKSDMHNCLQQFPCAFLFRILSYALVCFWLIFPMAILGTISISWQDRTIFKWNYWRNLMQTLFGKHGLFYLIVGQSIAYMAFSFHPDHNAASNRYVTEYDQTHPMDPKGGNRSA